MPPDGWSLDRGSWHFHRRLWERYGFRLEYGEFSRIVGDVQRGQAVLLRRGNSGADGAHYAVKLASGRWIKVVVNKRKVPISALPWTRKGTDR